MIGVLAAAGLMGGLALVLAELTKQQMGIQKRLETEVEIISLSNRMVHVLYNGDSCKNTLYADIPAPYRINANDFHTINNIKDKDGDDVFSKGSVYGNRLVKIEDMQLKVPGTVSGKPGGGGPGGDVQAGEQGAHRVQEQAQEVPPDAGIGHRPLAAPSEGLRLGRQFGGGTGDEGGLHRPGGHVGSGDQYVQCARTGRREEVHHDRADGDGVRHQRQPALRRPRPEPLRQLHTLPERGDGRFHRRGDPPMRARPVGGRDRIHPAHRLRHRRGFEIRRHQLGLRDRPAGGWWGTSNFPSCSNGETVKYDSQGDPTGCTPTVPTNCAQWAGSSDLISNGKPKCVIRSSVCRGEYWELSELACLT